MWGFNMEQLIRIVQKSIIKLGAMFKGNLVAFRRRFAFKRYQQTFPYFIASAQASNNCNEANGIVRVQLEERAVNQLWGEVKAVMKAATE